MTFEEAINLKYGNMIHHSHYTASYPINGSCEIWLVNGKVKRWKKDLKRFSIPLRFKLRAIGAYTYLTNENIALYHLKSECHRHCQRCGRFISGQGDWKGPSGFDSCPGMNPEILLCSSCQESKESVE